MNTVFHKLVVELVEKAGYINRQWDASKHLTYRKLGDADVILPARLNDFTFAKRVLRIWELRI